MKKILLIIAALAVGFVAGAQNNPYDIDDECYVLYRDAESLLGKPGFEEANAALLKKAIQKNDTKAQTLYYVSLS